MRAVLRLAMFLLLLPPSVAAGSYLQVGADAARTGVLAESGLEWNDVAFVLDLPKPGSTVCCDAPPPPLILDGSVFVASNRRPNDTLDALVGARGNGTIYRVSTTDASYVMVAQTASPICGWASDGDRLFVATEVAVHAFELSGGNPGWTLDVSMKYGSSLSHPDDVQDYVRCVPPALREGVLYAGYYDSTASSLSVRVLAIDASTGALRWEWVKERSDPRMTESMPSTQGANGADYLWTQTMLNGAPIATYAEDLVGVSVVGGYAYASTASLIPYPSQPGQPAQNYVGSTLVYRIDVETGQGNSFAGVGPAFYPLFAGLGDPSVDHIPPPTGDDERLFLKLDYLNQLRGPDPTFATSERQTRQVRDRVQEGDWGSGLAYDGEHVYVTTLRHLYKLDLGLQTKWPRFTLEGESWARGPLVVTDRCIYGLSRTDTNVNALYCINPLSGLLRWKHDAGTDAAFAVGDGIAAIHTAANRLTVLGSTPASIRLDPRIENQYPPLGEPAVVDLSGTGAGAFGPATAFTVEWGDGTLTDWQPDPHLSHTYVGFGRFPARIVVRNEAGQTASDAATFYPGQTPPGLTPLQKAFSPQNQNTTFFFLGLVVTLLFSAYGLFRVATRRSRFRKELSELEEGFERSKERPQECEDYLSDRRLRARRLLLSSKLDEGQTAVLEKRADELRSRLRFRALDRRIQFLPHGLVLSLQEHLRDGTINAWEHNNIMGVIEKDRILSKRQKDEVRALVDEWFARDSRVKA